MSEKRYSQRKSPKRRKRRARLENQGVKVKKGRRKKGSRLVIEKLTGRRKDSAKETETSGFEEKRREVKKTSTTQTAESETISDGDKYTKGRETRHLTVLNHFWIPITHKDTSLKAVSLALE